jgi:hypothetical protein
VACPNAEQAATSDRRTAARCGREALNNGRYNRDFIGFAIEITMIGSTNERLLRWKQVYRFAAGIY